MNARQRRRRSRRHLARWHKRSQWYSGADMLPVSEQDLIAAARYTWEPGPSMPVCISRLENLEAAT